MVWNGGVDVLEIVVAQAMDRDFILHLRASWAFSLPGIGGLFLESASGVGFRPGKLGRWTLKDDLSAVFPSLGADFDDMIGISDDIGLMFDDQK